MNVLFGMCAMQKLVLTAQVVDLNLKTSLLASSHVNTSSQKGEGGVMISFLKQTTRVAGRKSLFKDVFALVIHKAKKSYFLIIIDL